MECQFKKYKNQAYNILGFFPDVLCMILTFFFWKIFNGYKAQDNIKYKSGYHYGAENIEPFFTQNKQVAAVQDIYATHHNCQQDKGSI